MNIIIPFLQKLFKTKQKTPAFNMHHPDLASNVEFAFEVGGRKFYRFVKDYQMPTGRYKFAEAYMNEAEIKMTLSTLKSYMDEIEKNLDGSKGQINIGKCFQVIWAVRSRCQLGFSPERIERLATAIFFDEHEDLSDLDVDYCNQKIQFWRKHDSLAFFLTTPIGDLLGVNGFSETSFQDFLKRIQIAEDLVRSLTFDPEKESLQNTSETKSTN